MGSETLWLQLPGPNLGLRMTAEPQESGNVFADLKGQLKKAFAQLPENPVIPYHLTEEGHRASQFKAGCPKEFCTAINRNILKNPWAFDQVAKWPGTYPGPLASGPTGQSKTRAAWSVLGRLYVKEGRHITSFTAKRIMEKYFEHHMSGEPARFWSALSRFDVFLLDDIDKFEINDRNCTVLFELLDWIYANHRAVVCTNNRPRDWWAEKMGTAFARRMFDEAFFTVPF